MQKHLPVGGEPLTTCGAGILPSSREGKQYRTPKSEAHRSTANGRRGKSLFNPYRLRHTNRTKLDRYRKEKEEISIVLVHIVLTGGIIFKSHHGLSYLESHTPTISPGSGGISPHGPGIDSTSVLNVIPGSTSQGSSGPDYQQIDIWGNVLIQ